MPRQFPYFFQSSCSWTSPSFPGLTVSCILPHLCLKCGIRCQFYLSTLGCILVQRKVIASLMLFLLLCIFYRDHMYSLSKDVCTDKYLLVPFLSSKREDLIRTCRKVAQAQQWTKDHSLTPNPLTQID
jgi:hypothetical protein